MAPPNARRVYLFHGDDTFALAEARKKLEAKVLDPAWREFNLTTLGPEASAAQAAASVLTTPFGAGGRLVVVTDAPYLLGKSEDEGVPDLEKLIASGLPESAHLLFILPKVDGRMKLAKVIGESGAVREFAQVKSWNIEKDLHGYVTEVARKQGARIAPDAVTAVLAATGADRYRIQHEVEKLAIAVPEGQPITLALVRELTARGEVEVFALTEAIAKRDVGEAFSAIGKLLVNDHVLKVLAAVVTIVRGWARTKLLAERGLNTQQIARELGAKSDFIVGKNLGLLRGWRANELTAALDHLLDVDLAIKSGKWPTDAQQTLLERAIVQMLQRQPAPTR